MELFKEESPKTKKEEKCITENAVVDRLKNKETKSKKAYRDYRDLQTKCLLVLLNNGISTTTAAKQLEIKKNFGLQIQRAVEKHRRSCL